MTPRSWIRRLFARTNNQPRRNDPLRPSLEVLEDRQTPAVLTVNSLLDNAIAGDNLVTLREALLAANSDGATDLGQTGSGADTIVFDPALTASGPATVLLGQVEDNT